MSATTNAVPSTAKFLRSPRTAVGRFVAKHTARSSLILGMILVFYMISKASTYLVAYPTEAARQKIAESLGTNVGIEALLGVAHHIDTVSGYVTWNFLCLIAAVGAIWALLITTKTFRGEEDAGRWELFLGGQTTARRAASNALAGLASGLVIVYTICFLGLLGISRFNGAYFTLSACLFFALALTAGAAEFMAIGFLASQLMPTRSRAAGLSAVIFGVFYMIRLTADSTSAHWLLNVSPLGWIERLQPMYNSQPIWLLPIGGFVLVLSGLAIWLAGRRDLGDGIVADKDTAKPHTRFLRSPFGVALRLNRAVILGWLIAVISIAYLYGELTKSAAQIVQSTTVESVFSRLAQAAHTQAVLAFLGFTLFFIMLVVMFYVASAVGRMRDDEAKGYLDNFLVRPVSRNRWLLGRIFLMTTVVVIACLLGGLSTWAGEATQHGGVTFHTLLLAGVNIMAPVLLILGIGIFSFGVMPRLTSVITFAAIGWSFLITMLGSGVSLNHWLLDTSLFHHVALVPAVGANWTTSGILVVLGLIFGLIGVLRFNTRDLRGE